MMNASFATAEVTEGVLAMVAKRPPAFPNHDRSTA